MVALATETFHGDAVSSKLYDLKTYWLGAGVDGWLGVEGVDDVANASAGKTFARN
jgi:hypothetical protein